MIVQLKDNQPTLCCKVEAVCNDTKPLSCAQTVDSKKRNRHETRTVAVFNAQPAVAGTEWQPHVAAIIAIERNVDWHVRRPQPVSDPRRIPREGYK